MLIHDTNEVQFAMSQANADRPIENREIRELAEWDVS